MSAGSIGDDGFAALRDLAIELAEAGDFLAAAQRFQDALAAASRLPGPPTAAAAAATAEADGAAAAAAQPAAPPAFIGLAAAAGAGAGPGPGLGLGCGHSHVHVHGQSRAAASQLAAAGEPRRELAAAHDMLAQCLMQLAIEEGEGGGGAEAAAAAGRGRGRGLAGGRSEEGRGEREEGEAAGEVAAAREAALWEEALRSAAEACRLLPWWVPPRLTYARCLRNCGLLDEALRELNGAMQILGANRAAIRAGGAVPSPVAAAAPESMSEMSTELGAERIVNTTARAALGAAAEGPKQSAPESDAAAEQQPDRGLGLPDPGLEAEVADELSEVSELWQQRLAHDVGLPGLRIQQDAGVLGEGPGRRVWECGVLLAAYLVQQQQQQQQRQAASPPQVSHDGGGADACGGVTGGVDTAHIGLSGARVLELGCGSGLVGITAAACGAHCVLTDLPPVLPAAAACAAANAGLIRAGGGSVAVRPLDWGEGNGGDGGGDGGGEGAGAAAAASWLWAGQGPWAAVEANACDWQEPEVSGEGELAGKLNGAAESSFRWLLGAGRQQCWVLGADLVYSEAQVDALVGLLVALRRAVQRVHPPVFAVAAPDLDMGATAAESGLSRQEAASYWGNGIPARSCSLLLAHKHRNEAVSRRLWDAMHAAGIELRQVELTEAGMVRRLAGQLPSVMLYESKLW